VHLQTQSARAGVSESFELVIAPRVGLPAAFVRARMILAGSGWQMGSWPRDKRTNAVAAAIIIACWGLLIIHTLGHKKTMDTIKDHAP
jgi:hypothetical protein